MLKNFYLPLIIFFFYSSVEASEREANLPSPYDNVLLVIHYNHPYYQSVQFLKELYSVVFPNIVFYGTKNSPGDGVQGIDTRDGFLFAKVMNDVLLNYPDYEGYLFLQDDCVLNYWNFNNLDQSKIWYAISFNDEKEDFYSVINLKDRNGFRPKWYWWPTQWGASVTAKVLSTLPEKSLNQLEANIGHNTAVGQMCDMFYLPGKYRDDAVTLSQLFSNVFCEIAVPMILCSLAPISHWERLTMSWSNPAGNFNMENYPYDIHWVHPIKFSNQNNRDFILNIFKTQ